MNVRVLPLFFLCGSYREEPCCPASIQSDVPSAVILRAYGYMRKKMEKTSQPVRCWCFYRILLV